MLFNVCGLFVGLMILGGGLFYLINEKDDKESNKIYGITTCVGLVIVLFMIMKWFVL